MERFLTAYYPTAHGDIKKVQLFGYATNSIPGIEIVGLGRGGRALKEKLIFFTRKLRLKLPIKRFVLCLEEDNLPVGDLSYLEFPLLFLLLNLAEIIQLGMLEDSLCSGRLLLNGTILFPSLTKYLQQTEADRSERTLLLSVHSCNTLNLKEYRYIVVEDLFEERGLCIDIKSKEG